MYNNFTIVIEIKTTKETVDIIADLKARLDGLVWEMLKVDKTEEE